MIYAAKDHLVVPKCHRFLIFCRTFFHVFVLIKFVTWLFHDWCGLPLLYPTVCTRRISSILMCPDDFICLVETLSKIYCSACTLFLTLLLDFCCCCCCNFDIIADHF